MMRSAQIQKKGGQKQKILTRNSSLELLRIIAMLMIVMHHCAIHTPWLWEGTNPMNHAFVTFCSSFGKVGVGIFFLITGYFIFSTKNFYWKRIFKIIRPVWFYSFTIFGIALLIGSVTWGFPLPIKNAFSLFPIITNAYWFVGAYLGIQLLAPFIKKWLDALTQKKLLILNAIIFGIIIIPSLLNIFLISKNIGPFTLPTALGFTILGYTVHRLQHKIKTSAWAWVGVLSSIMLFIIAYVVWAYVLPKIGYVNVPTDFIRSNYSLPVVILSLSLFIIFTRIKLKSKIINYVASLVFGIYLIHDNIWVRDFLWSHFDFINPLFYTSNSIVQFAGYFLGMVIFVFLSSGIIEAIRRFVTKISVTFINFTKMPTYK